MLNSSRNVFVTILNLNLLEIQLGISIYKKKTYQNIGRLCT